MSNERKFAEDCLSAINKYRANHQVKPLTYNREIEAVARQWADHMARRNDFNHNPDRSFKGTKLGENISRLSKRSQDEITGPKIAGSWYSEIKDYDFGANRGRGTGHFTQVVWKDSKELGIARAQTKDGDWMVVADFYPPGNYNNDYANNVFPPKDGKVPTPTNKDERHQRTGECSVPRSIKAAGSKDGKVPTPTNKNESQQRTDSQQQHARTGRRSHSKHTSRSTVNGVTTTTIRETIIEDGVETVTVTKTVES